MRPTCALHQFKQDLDQGYGNGYQQRNNHRGTDQEKRNSIHEENGRHDVLLQLRLGEITPQAAVPAQNAAEVKTMQPRVKNSKRNIPQHPDHVLSGIALRINKRKRMLRPSVALNKGAADGGSSHLRPKEKEEIMSSTSPDQYLTSKDLNMLQSILIATGYWCDTLPKPRESYVAAKLIIKLFQRGIIEPESLSDALIQYMGSRIPDMKPYALPAHRFAIQGITPEMPTLH